MTVYSDELCHGIKGWTKPGHKYLTREWKNGRWRYYYSKTPDKSLGGTIRRISGYDAREYAEQAKRAYEHKKIASDTYERYSFSKDPLVQKWSKIIINDARQAKTEAIRAALEYEKTPLGKLEKTGQKVSSITQSTIDSGRYIVESILDDASRKIQSYKR